VTDFIAALGLVLVIEGLVFAAFPAASKRAVALMLETPESQLRAVGVVSAVLVVIVVWFARG
jgi:uncharacterized protein YjeT (DUF2065 family)